MSPPVGRAHGGTSFINHSAEAVEEAPGVPLAWTGRSHVSQYRFLCYEHTDGSMLGHCRGYSVSQ